MTVPLRPVALPGRRTHDVVGPALVAASLAVHVAALILLVRAPRATAASPPMEIPVEVVEMPAVKPPAAEKPAPKPAAKPHAAEASAKAETHPAETRAAKPKAARATRSRPDAPAGHDVAERMRQLLGPMPAAVMPGAATGDNASDDAVSYRQVVLSQVARQRREDRHNGVPGHVVVTFTVGDAGDVVRCAVREKSVDPALDAEAVAMVYRGAPYPPPPPGAERGFSFGLAFRPT